MCISQADQIHLVLSCTCLLLFIYNTQDMFYFIASINLDSLFFMSYSLPNPQFYYGWFEFIKIISIVFFLSNIQ